VAHQLLDLFAVACETTMGRDLIESSLAGQCYRGMKIDDESYRCQYQSGLVENKVREGASNAAKSSRSRVTSGSRLGHPKRRCACEQVSEWCRYGRSEIDLHATLCLGHGTRQSVVPENIRSSSTSPGHEQVDFTSGWCPIFAVAD
jgi:hypothetical protein